MNPMDPQAPMPEEETMTTTPEEMPAEEEATPAETTEEVM